MKLFRLFLLAFVFHLAAFAQDGQQQFASLGDFKLESGEAIRDCRLGYRIFGSSTLTSPTPYCFQPGSPEPRRN
jgi:hypothetical protein